MVLGRSSRHTSVSPAMRFDRRDRRHEVTIYTAPKRLRNIACADRQRVGSRQQQQQVLVDHRVNSIKLGDAIRPEELALSNDCGALKKHISITSQTNMKAFSILGLTSLAFQACVIAEPNIAALRTIMTDSRFVGLVS